VYLQRAIVSNSAALTNISEVTNEAVAEIPTAGGLMEKLWQTTREIDEAGQLIGDIDAQTNLLVLSATIDAARASEARTRTHGSVHRSEGLFRTEGESDLNDQQLRRWGSKGERSRGGNYKKGTLTFSRIDDSAENVASEVGESIEGDEKYFGTMAHVGTEVEEPVNDIAAVCRKAQNTQDLAWEVYNFGEVVSGGIGATLGQSVSF